MPITVFTIGHSTHTIEAFIALLKLHGITAVCDVRSSPYSRINPQFNRHDLKASLKEHAIQYVFLGKELGARSDDLACYHEGKVQYDALARTDLFRSGIERIRKGARDFKVALMCAEKDPLECHRTILVSRVLDEEGFNVSHILSNGDVEVHESAIDRLVHTLKMGHGDLFMSDAEKLNQAYRIQGEAIAYTLKEDEHQKHPQNQRIKA